MTVHASPSSSAKRAIGAAHRRREDPRILRGLARHVDDIDLAGTLHLAFVRSPFASARLGRIDLAAARQAPGVLAACSAIDFPEMRPIQSGNMIPDMRAPALWPLAKERVEAVGIPVAVVAAASPAEARDAVDLIDVDYEPGQVLVDAGAAAAEGAPVIHPELGTNVAFRLRRGNTEEEVEAALARSATRVHLSFEIPRVAAIPLEPRGVLVVPDPANPPSMTIYATTQVPFRLRDQMAGALGVPSSAIRVVAPDVGGGFGVRGITYREYVVAALLASRLRRPVRWIATRSEDVLTTAFGRGVEVEVDGGCDAAGHLTVLRSRVWVNAGSHAVFQTSVPSVMIANVASGAYRIPVVASDIVGVYTNTGTLGTYRGAGRPEAAFMVERLVDELARARGEDPVQFRRRNFISPDAFPYRTPVGTTYDSGNYEQALDRALALVDYQEVRGEQEQLRAAGGGVQLGIGCSCFVESSASGWESSLVRVLPSGEVEVYVGSSAHGQGHETTFAQVVSDQLGVPMERIQIRFGDTAIGPVGTGTFGSRSVVLAGSALMRACERVVEKATRVAAHLLEASGEDVQLDLGAGQFLVSGVPDRRIPWARVAGGAYGMAPVPGEEPGLEATAFFQPPRETYSFGTYVAVVRVEEETGRVSLEKLVGVDDCGRQINPLLLEGQILGGLAQAIGEAMMERAVYDEAGQLLTGSLLDYTAPRAADMPPSLLLDHTETPSPLNPLGAKGVGEAGTTGAPPAIANAVLDALRPLGVKDLSMPFTADRVWAAIHRARESRDGRLVPPRVS